MGYPKQIHWWVDNVLPLVYSEALSYMEVVGKITEYVNGLTTDMSTVKFQIEVINAEIEQIDPERIATLLEDMDELEAIVGGFEDRVEALESAMTVVGGKVSTLESNVDDLDTLTGSLQTTVENLSGRVGVIESTTATFDTRIANAENLATTASTSASALGLRVDSVESDVDNIDDKVDNVIDSIAKSETWFTATRNYASGEIIYIGGTLYKATTDINSGDSLVIGTNISATNVSDEIVRINTVDSGIDTRLDSIEADNRAINSSFDYINSAISYDNTEIFTIGNTINRTTQGPGYKITENGSVADANKITIIYPIGNKPIYIKSQDGVQYRSVPSVSGFIKTLILGEFDGVVYPYTGANYIAISCDISEQATYLCWECISNINSLDGRLDTAESDIDSIDGRLDTAESDINALDGRLDTDESDINTLGGRLDTAESNINALDGRLDTAESDIITLDGRLDTAESGINATSEKTNSNERIISVDNNYLFSKGKEIAPYATASNYRISNDGTTYDETRAMKIYQINDAPLFIKTQDGFQYRRETGSSTYIATFLGEYEGIIYPYPNANYVAITFEKTSNVYKAWGCVANTAINTLVNSKINCLGDSYTDDLTSWMHVIEDRVQLTAINVAKGNSAIVTDYTGAPSFLSRIDGAAPKEGGGYYTGLDTTADITVIFGGINDCRDIHSGAITLGTINSTHDATTFYGGMQLLLDRIIAMEPQQFILGVIPPSFQPNAPYTTYIGDIQAAEREIYRKYHIPFVDLAYDCFAMSDNNDVMALYRKSVTGDTNYHPNALGAKKICDLIQNKLEGMYRNDN